MIDNTEGNNGINDAYLVKDLLNKYRNSAGEITIDGQLLSAKGDLSQIKKIILGNPAIVNDDSEVLKDFIKLILQTENPRDYMDSIFNSSREGIKLDVWIEIFSEEKIFEELSDVLTYSSYYSQQIEGSFNKLCIELVDFATNKIERKEESVDNAYNKKTKNTLKNIYGMYAYKCAKDPGKIEYIVKLLEKFDKVKHIISEDETTRNRVDEIFECIINEYSWIVENFPGCVYEYLGNKIKDNGLDLNGFLFLVLDKSVKFIEKNKDDPRYENLIECYTSVKYGEDVEIKGIDKEEDIFKLNERLKGTL